MTPPKDISSLSHNKWKWVALNNMHNFWVIVGLWSLHTLPCIIVACSIIYSYTLDMNNYSDSSTRTELLQTRCCCCTPPVFKLSIKDQYGARYSKNEQKMGVGNHIYFSPQMKRPQGKHGSYAALVVVILALSYTFYFCNILIDLCQLRDL